MPQSPFKLSNKLPSYFLERYWEEFAAWAKNIRKIGKEKSIVLKEGPFADPSPNEEMGPVLLQVKLELEPSDHGTILIKPKTERDEWLIRDHVQKLQRYGVKARQFWKEAPRLWIPGMPVIDPE